MKIKTSDLAGQALDWAVAKIDQQQWSDYDCLLWVQDDEYQYNPSTDWSQGGPIIEREKLEVRANDYEWQAFCFGFPSARAHSGKKVWASGPTPLIAAMRCVVAANLGDEVDIPDELFNP